MIYGKSSHSPQVIHAQLTSAIIVALVMNWTVGIIKFLPELLLLQRNRVCICRRVLITPAKQGDLTEQSQTWYNAEDAFAVHNQVQVTLSV